MEAAFGQLTVLMVPTWLMWLLWIHLGFGGLGGVNRVPAGET
jgi:hypothetical protein